MKIFEKEKNGNRRIFYFLGKKFLSYKKVKCKHVSKEKSPFEIYEYIKKYEYVLDFPVEPKESNLSGSLLNCQGKKLISSFYR